MSSSPSTVLLAVLIALSELENSLTTKESNELRDIGRKLHHNPNNLHDTNLVEIVKKNHTLYQHFQEIKSTLEELDKASFSDLLPTERELEEAYTSPNKRIPLEGGKPIVTPSDTKKVTIENAFIDVTSTPDLSQTSKRLGFFEKYLNLLNRKNDE